MHQTASDVFQLNWGHFALRCLGMLAFSDQSSKKQAILADDSRLAQYKSL